MTLPQQVFLRSTRGDPVGPLALTALEVLYDARIVDERTPLSINGQAYQALAEWPQVLDRLKEVKDALGRGEDPWPERLPRTGETTAQTVDIAPNNLIGALVARAGIQSTGQITVAAPTGDIVISLRDGKVVSVHTSIPELVLSEYLLDRQLIDEAALATAGAAGGDLGAALVAQGLVAPHVYFEALVGWAKWVLGKAAFDAESEPSFEITDVPAPSVPLGFDRFALPVEIVREQLGIDQMRERLSPKRRCPLIISQVEGAIVEDCKLTPRELRVINKVNGIVSLQDLLAELGGSNEKDHPILCAVFFAEQAGFIVFGEDVSARRERAEAATLRATFQRMAQLNDFEILGVDEKSSDEEVRSRYFDMVKAYHPDKVTSDADPALLEIRRKLFALVSGAFERQETEKERYRYAYELEQGGVVASAEPAQHLKNPAQAELAFQKALVLIKRRKYDEALAEIDNAIELNSNEAKYKIQRHYIQYLDAAKSGDIEGAAQQAIRKILDVMNLNANIVDGYLLLGELHKVVNKPEVAHRYYEKVLEYEEGHPVAMQEVRLGNMRKERNAKKKKRWL